MLEKFNETDLYPPIQKFFTELGYRVNAEVKGCDVAMTKDNELVIIELKKTFNMTLLYQLMDRQRLTTQVYAAIPRPKRAKGAEYTNMLQIAKKLEIGLMTVALDSPVRHVEVLVFPPAAVLKALKKPARRAGVLKEMAGRTIDSNLGGSTRRKLMTAYREKAVRIACVMERHGDLSGKELVALGCDAKARNIAADNHYGWFLRVSKGIYRLTQAGLDMLASGEFGALVQHFRAECAKQSEQSHT